jgi:hypothetical protein
MMMVISGVGDHERMLLHDLGADGSLVHVVGGGWRAPRS